MNKYKNDLDKKIKLANDQAGADTNDSNFLRKSMSIEDFKINKNTNRTKNNEIVDKMFEDYKLEKDKSIKNSYYYSLQKDQLAKNLKKKSFDINSINYFNDLTEIKKQMRNSLLFEEVNSKRVPITVKINELSQKVFLIVNYRIKQ